MIVRRMRYFAAVVRQGGVARAASELRIAQPALSRQIQSLERVIGAALFERGPRGLLLTGAGVQLLRRVDELTTALERAIHRARLAAAGELGTLKLGLSRIALHRRQVGSGLAELREHYPEIEIAISEVPSTSQPDALVAGDLELAIGVHGTAEDAALERLVLYEEQVDCATLPAGHPLAREREIDPSALRAERLHVLDPAIAKTIPEFFESLRRQGFREWHVHETPASMYTLIAAGRGWTPVPRSLAKEPPLGTAVVPLRGFRIPIVVAVRWRATGATPLIRNVARLLKRHCGGGADASTERGRRITRQGVSNTERPSAKEGSLGQAIELRHLRALVMAAAEGSLNRAADRLGITQSGLSRQIASLEREIGVPLVERRANGIVLTPAGEVLRADATSTLAFVDEVIEDVRHVASGLAGRCRIGAIPGEVAGQTIIAALNRASQLCPEIAIEVREMLSPLQGPALRAREIDVGVAGAFPGVSSDPRLASLRIAGDVVDCALVAESHPLAKRKLLRVADLETQPFVFVARATYPHLYDTIMDAFEELGLKPRMYGAVDGARAIWRIVADSRAWSVGTRAMRTCAPTGLVAVPIDGFTIPAGVHLLWRRDERNPTVRAVLDVFRAPGVPAPRS